MLSLLRKHVSVGLCVLLGCATVTSAANLTLFRGKDSGTFTVTATSDPNVIHTLDVGAGESSRLGRYRLVAEELVNLVTLDITNGSFLITTHNGDTISGTYAGRGRLSQTPGVILYDVAGPITGGTGRFAGATGVLGMLGSADLTGGTFTDIVVGALSDRK